MFPAALEAHARHWAKSLLPFYHRLPAPARHVAVSARGWTLARLRRSAWARDEAALGARLEGDPTAAAAVAADRLRAVLVHAGATVPYYTRLFARHGFDPAKVRGPEALRRLPILERHQLRDAWNDFQSVAVADADSIVTSTSGTTGAGLRVRATPEAYARTWAQQLRHWRWAGVPSGEWRITLFGAEIVSRRAAGRRPWVYNVPDRQILLSAYHLAPRWADAYRARLERRRLPVEGFPSVLRDVAHVIGPARPGRPRARVVFTTGEALTAEARVEIEQAFGARVLDEYGEDEKVGFILECRAGTYHRIVEYGVLEVVDDGGEPVPAGGEGHLLWTGLVNLAMPLVRYRIGDEGAVRAGGDACPCGVRYPAVAPTLTRTGDSLRLAGGQRVSPRLLNQLLKECRSFAAAQFVQEGPALVTILAEAAGAGAAAEAEALARRLEAQFGGGVHFRSRLVETIDRDPSAKRRLVVVRREPDAS
jgi:phenylacetate-coenzyme A ligase PaaK-like adenylate-forming protein